MNISRIFFSRLLSISVISISSFWGLFPDRALSLTEFEYQGCSISVDGEELVVNFNLFGMEEYETKSCYYQTEVRSDNVTYQLIFDLKSNATSSLEVINLETQEKNRQILPEFSTFNSISALPLNLSNRQKKSLAIVYQNGGAMGYCNGFKEITVYDRTSLNGFSQLSTDTITSVKYEPREYPTYISFCTDFKDIDGDGIYEIEMLDRRFGYEFSSGADSASPSLIFQLTPSGLQDVTLKHPNYLRNEAKKLWDGVISRRNEAARSEDTCPRYFGYMYAYAAIKSLLNEYPDAINKIEERMSMDYHLFANSDCYDFSSWDFDRLNSLLSEYGYIR